MRIKNLLSSICAASFVALSLVGCSDYDNGYTEQQLQFIQNFKEIYGEVDPTQDWNLAERAKVTVTTSTTSDIKIYAKTNGVYSLVGHYSDVSGTQTLGFDVIEGTTEIMVSNGSSAQYTTVGNSVTFNPISTRGIIDDSKAVSQLDDYFYIDQETYMAWYEYVPEGKYNRNKVVDDFVYVSTGDFYLYPIYWNTSNSVTVYIYYYDDNNVEHSIPVYSIKGAGEDLQYVANWRWVTCEDPNDPINQVTVENAESQGYIVTDNYKPIYGNNIKPAQWADGAWVDNVWVDGKIMIQGAQYADLEVDEEGNVKWIDASSNENQPYPVYTNTETGSWESGPAALRTKGMKISLEEGTVFGIYITADAGNKLNKFYSNSARNEDTDNATNGKAVHACTFEDNDILYLGFEDWSGDDSPASDFDLNDCMFMIEGAIPAITNEEGNSWIISAEDLGNTLDIDYNDVVLQVQYISGEDDAYVTPLAAGGTLASYVFFEKDGVEIPLTEKKGQVNEIHQLFGVPETESGSYAPINVDNDMARPTEYASTIPVPVGTNFTLATSEVGKEEYDDAVASNMGGFKIKVLLQGQTTFDESKVQVVQNSNRPDIDNVPYVICTPKTWINGDWKKTGHYRWPRESVPMLSENGNGIAAYGTPGHSFAEWVVDKTKATDWFAYPYTEDDGATFPNTCAPGRVTDVTSGDTGSGGTPGTPTDPEKAFTVRIDIDRSGTEYYKSDRFSGNNININLSDYSEDETIQAIEKGDVFRIYIEKINNGGYTGYTNNDIIATYGETTYKQKDGYESYGIAPISITGSGTQKITIEAPADEAEEFSARTITINFTVVKPNNGDEISIEDTNPDIKGTSYEDNTYTIPNTIISNYKEEEKVTLTIQFNSNQHGQGGDMICQIGDTQIKEYGFNWYSSPNPHKIELSGDNLANAMNKGLVIICKQGMTIDAIYIKAGSASSKRRANRRKQ